MEKLSYYVSSTGAVVGTLFTFLFGKWEIGLQILVACMILDYTLGLMCGTKNKNLSSDIGFKGLKKKFTIIIILILAVLLDRLIGQGWVFRTLVCYFYIANEGISLLENCSGLGLPIPEKIKNALIQLKEGEKKDITDK